MNVFRRHKPSSIHPPLGGTRGALLALGVTALLTGCDLVRYHPYEERFEGPEQLNRLHMAQVEEWGRGRTAFRLAFISDTQRHYDDTDDAVNHINNWGDVDFVLHGGDLTDFGLTSEFVWMRDILLRLNKPWMTAIGNHDFLGTGEQIYQRMYGEYNYGFTVGHTRFEVLNTSALESDHDTPVPDFGFLEREISHLKAINAATPDSITQTIVMMHARPGDEQFNNGAIEELADCLARLPRLLCCLCGHNHHNQTMQPMRHGITFHQVADIHKRYYMILEVRQGEYDYHYVTF